MPSITAILTTYRRLQTLRPQVEALRAQSVPPTHLWLWANEPTAELLRGFQDVPADRVVASSANAYFHARFALALTALTEYVAVFDDDTIPGPRWFENCLETMARTPGILGTAGVLLHAPRYASCTKHGWHAPAPHAIEVDLVGQGWFLRTAWVHFLFAAPPVLGTNGEDIELAARAWRLGGIPCYCPPHPPGDTARWGSTRGAEFGDDAAAAFRRASHVAERDRIVEAEIAAGWQPLFLWGERDRAARLQVAVPGAGSSEPLPTLQRASGAGCPPDPAPSGCPDARGDRSPRGLVSLIPDSARRILLVHCGDGILGSQLKARQEAVVIGIERDARSAASARSRLDQVLEVDLEAPDPPLDGAPFDCVVLDRFEDFREPAAVIGWARRSLSPDGRVIAGIHNVQQHGVVEDLLKGSWSPTSRESPDHRQLRFYTRREIEKLFFRCGWTMHELHALPTRGCDAWMEQGRPREVHVGPLHITGTSAEDAEQFYVDRYLVSAEPAVVPAYGLTSIILVLHNQLEYTRQCVESIRERTGEPIELVFVDNGSTDGTVEYLHALGDASVRVILNAENRGFPAAVNQGIEAAQGDQILLLNNDTIVTTAWLRRMLRALSSDLRIGLVGPCSNNVSGTQQIAVRYEDLGGLDGFAWEWGRAHDGVVADTDRLVGFCLLIRRAVIDQIGLFDERFGTGCFEDDDYCLRAIRAGYRAVIARDAFVHHFAGGTFRASSIDFAGLLRRNQALFREKLRALAIEASGETPAEWKARRKRPGRSPRYAVRPGSDGGLLVERGAKRLSLALIMRNNAGTIGACLESIRPWVDDMIAVDTGSTDETPRIAERLGARVCHFPWCDSFSAARNESFRHARGDWIFWMDSDDTIDAENGLKLRLLALRDGDPSILGHVMQVHCPGRDADGGESLTVVDQVHLVRNCPELRWDRRIHEQLIPAIRRAGGEVGWTDIAIVHSGADRTPEGLQRKLERDLKLLHLELQETPDHPFTLFNLGMTYRDAREYDKAIYFLRRSIERSGAWESQLRKAYALLISSTQHLGKLDHAVETCERALGLFPDDAELRFQQGGLLHLLGRLEEAAEAYRRVLSVPDAPHFASVEQGITGHLTRHNLAVVYSSMGLLDLAEEQWRRAAEEAPSFREAWRGLGDVLIRRGNLQDAVRLIERLVGDDHLRAEGLMLKRQLAVARGDTAGFVGELDRAAAEHPSDLETLRVRSQFLCEHGDSPAAEAALRHLLELAPSDASAHYNLGTLYLKTGRFVEAVRACRESLRACPDNPLALLHLGYALKESGQRDEAVSAFEQVVRLAPGDPAAARAQQELHLLAANPVPATTNS